MHSQWHTNTILVLAWVKIGVYKADGKATIEGLMIFSPLLSPHSLSTAVHIVDHSLLLKSLH